MQQKVRNRSNEIMQQQLAKMRLTLISIFSVQNHAESRANSHVYAVAHTATIKHHNY